MDWIHLSCSGPMNKSNAGKPAVVDTGGHTQRFTINISSEFDQNCKLRQQYIEGYEKMNYFISITF